MATLPIEVSGAAMPNDFLINDRREVISWLMRNGIYEKEGRMGILDWRF
jgi:hypothetical protein